MKSRLYANAPCSWGVEFAGNPKNPPWRQVLREIASTGFQATELGPLGYLPTDTQVLREALVEYQLSIVAGTLFQHFSHVEKLSDIVNITKKICTVLSAVEASYLVFIDHVAAPRTDVAGQSLKAERLDQGQWNLMMMVMAQCASICMDYNIIPVLHPHVGTFIEYEDELHRAMEDLAPHGMKLCLDTGHCTYAGIDPVHVIHQYEHDLEYIHLKDIQQSILTKACQESLDFYSAVNQGIFCPLGQGHVDFVHIQKALNAMQYNGWITVEQDHDLQSAASPQDNARDNFYYVSQIFGHVP